MENRRKLWDYIGLNQPNYGDKIYPETKKEALVIADDENLSLAIGKKGINIKLASRLTKYTINVKTIADINAEINR